MFSHLIVALVPNKDAGRPCVLPREFALRETVVVVGGRTTMVGFAHIATSDPVTRTHITGRTIRTVVA